MALFAGFAVCAGVAGAAQLDGNFDALSCQLLVLSNFYHDGALHTLPLELASDFIIASDILMGMISVCCASATAVESCKTILAGWLGVNIAASEILLDVRSRNPFIHISHQIFFFPNKLVAWVEIPPWSYGKIFCAASTS